MAVSAYILIQTEVGKAASVAEEVRRLPVHGAKGIVTLGEVAEIREAPAFRRGMARHDGHEDVSLRVVKRELLVTTVPSRHVPRRC